MRELNDWRLTNQESYLMRAKLVHREYQAANPSNSNPGSDHDHCEFCWAKFMTSGGSEVLTSGYATLDGYRWICEQCFNDFAAQFEWEVHSAA